MSFRKSLQRKGYPAQKELIQENIWKKIEKK